MHKIELPAVFVGNAFVVVVVGPVPVPDVVASVSDDFGAVPDDYTPDQPIILHTHTHTPTKEHTHTYKHVRSI